MNARSKPLLTDAAPSPHHQNSPVSAETSLPKVVKKRAMRENDFDVDPILLEDFTRERIANYIRDMFPAPYKCGGGNNDAETCRRAAKCLKVSERTVKNWLNCTHTPSLEHIVRLTMTSGIYQLMQAMTQGEGRLEIAKKVMRGVSRVSAK